MSVVVSLDAAGCYGVSLWHENKWTMVWVDGFFPCYVNNDSHARAPPRPIYASSANRREIWPMVAEKVRWLRSSRFWHYEATAQLAQIMTRSIPRMHHARRRLPSCTARMNPSVAAGASETPCRR